MVLNHAPKTSRSRRAFTLVECLIACGILVLAVTAFLTANVAGHRNSQHATDSQRAVRLAEEMMERIQGTPYDNIVPAYGHYSELPGQLKDLAGNPYPKEYQAFTLATSATATSMTVGGLGAATNGILVTVTVMDSKKKNLVWTRFIPKLN